MELKLRSNYNKHVGRESGNNFLFLNFRTVPSRFRVPGNEIKTFLFVSWDIRK